MVIAFTSLISEVPEISFFIFFRFSFISFNYMYVCVSPYECVYMYVCKYTSGPEVPEFLKPESQADMSWEPHMQEQSSVNC